MADSRGEVGPDKPDGRPDGPGGPGRALARLFGIQLLAVLAITVVLTGMFALVKRGDDSTTTALDRTTASAMPSASAPATTPPAATTPPPSSTPPPAPTTSAPTTSAPASAAPTTSAPDDNRPEVVIFNQNAPGGSGDAAAAVLRDQGWNIFKVDDFRGNVSTTTVYYPSGLEKAARRAARVLPGDVRTREKFSNLSDTRLTLILTDDYGG